MNQEVGAQQTMNMLNLDLGNPPEHEQYISFVYKPSNPWHPATATKMD